MNQQEHSAALIALAAKHVGENQSAMICLEDAKECAKTERHNAVKGRVLHSLRHSVGIFHEAYKAASAAAHTTALGHQLEQDIMNNYKQGYNNYIDNKMAIDDPSDEYLRGWFDAMDGCYDE